MNRILISKLQIGMILGENLYRGDQLVISSDVALNARHIEMLKRMDLESVKIITPSKPNALKSNPEKKYKASVEKFIEIYHSASIGNTVLYDHVKECIDPILEELEENPQMAMKLWQIETADFYTYEHSVKVTMLAVLLSKWLKKPDLYVQEIAKVGLLHDMGKCNIPNEILNKPDMLSSEEFSVMKTHSSLGYILLSSTKELNENILKGILHHHEKYNGTGYPSRLSGEDIPEYARIISIVDVFDAMSSDRVYREKMNPFRVLEIMQNGSNGSFDPAICDLFINHVKHFFVGLDVLLNNGEMAKIHDVNTPLAHRPIIELEGQLIDLTHNSEIEIKSVIMQG